MKNVYDYLYNPNGIDYGEVKKKLDGGASERELELLEKIKLVLSTYLIRETAQVLEIGASHGFNYQCHKNYTGIEYSQTAVNFSKTRFGAKINIKQGDATALKLDNESFDFIFTFATLEHIPEVEKCFFEIDRVLKKNGLAYIAPAWNCRPWTVEKLDFLSYSELSLRKKMGKLLIPIRENMIYRFLVSFTFRVLSESLRVVNNKVKLRYKKLAPNFDLIEKYGHVSDDDAFISMDSHSAMIWFLSRGYNIVSHNSLIKRLFCRGEGIIIRKNS